MPAVVANGRIDAVNERLIQRCRQGEQDAQLQLVRYTSEDVRRILFRLAGPVVDLEDLVQQVYLAMFSSLPGFRGESRFSTWLFSLCLHVVRKRYRSLGRWLRLRARLADNPPPAATDAREEITRVEQARKVWHTLERLSTRQREVLVMYEMEGMTGPQIAEILGIPQATVWTRLHHARRAFRRKFRWE